MRYGLWAMRYALWAMTEALAGENSCVRCAMVLAGKYTGRTMEMDLVIHFDNNEVRGLKTEGDGSAFSRLQLAPRLTFIVYAKKYIGGNIYKGGGLFLKRI